MILIANYCFHPKFSFSFPQIRTLDLGEGREGGHNSPLNASPFGRKMDGISAG
jgi:hypothetical protein